MDRFEEVTKNVNMVNARIKEQGLKVNDIKITVNEIERLGMEVIKTTKKRNKTIQKVLRNVDADKKQAIFDKISEYDSLVFLTLNKSIEVMAESINLLKKSTNINSDLAHSMSQIIKDILKDTTENDKL